MSILPKIENTNINQKIINKTKFISHSKSQPFINTNINFFGNFHQINPHNFNNINKNNNISIKNQKLAIETNINKIFNKNILEKDLSAYTRYIKNKKKKFKNLKNNIEFLSYNVNNYIDEANKIIMQRTEDKNADILGLKNKDKNIIISDTIEISRNNIVINNIKKTIKKIKLEQNNYKNSLIKSQNDMKKDLNNFNAFIRSKNDKIKEENAILLKLSDMHEQAMEKYDKEFQKYKKLMEELEKRIKFICMLKNYGYFIYKILGKKFWLDGIPEISHKTKNFEQVSDLIIEKFNLLYNKEKINNEENYFDDGFLIIKFNDLEQKIIQSIKNSQFRIWDLKEKVNKEHMLKKMSSTISDLKLQKNIVNIKQKILVRNVEKAKSIKFDEESTNKYLDYIIELEKETEKYSIDPTIYFPELSHNEQENTTIKKYDLKYYAIKTLNNLRKKEALINKFIEYIDKLKHSENKDIILKIENDLKKNYKREKLKELKMKQKQIHEEKNQKTLARNTRYVIKGRAVPKIYKFNKNKYSSTSLENKVKDDMELLYYNEDD